MSEINLDLLDAPFLDSEINWRPGNVREDSKAPEGFTALALAYIDSRAVMDRLDKAVGKANWRDEYAPAPAGGVMCTLYIRIDGEWIGKSDVGENTDFEAVKGGFSEALKRAAVKWGIGRSLYDLPNIYHPVKEHKAKSGKTSYSFIGTPKLPNLNGKPAQSATNGQSGGSTQPETKTEPPAKPKGAPAGQSAQGNAPEPGTNGNGKHEPRTFHLLIAYLRGLEASLKTGTTLGTISDGQQKNLAMQMQELMDNDTRKYLIYEVFGVESSKLLNERRFFAIKEWLKSDPQQLETEIKNVIAARKEQLAGEQQAADAAQGG